MRGDYCKILFIISLSLVVLLAAGGCTKRTNPVKASPPQGKIWDVPPITFTSLEGNLVGDVAIKKVFVYTPPGYEDPDQARTKYPVLYLLHGFGGNATTFGEIYNLIQVADELINRGEIQPMIIVMPDGSSTNFVGSFYTNSIVLPDTASYTGYYENYIVNDLMSYIDITYRARQNKEGQDVLRDSTYKDNRGISGHSMGGYGAFKIALDHDSLFCSVSAMSAPLAFNGDGTDFLGILEWIDGVFAENGVAKGDSAGYKGMSPLAGHLSAKMFAMAAAFSPHTHLDYSSRPPRDTTYRFLQELGGWGVDIPIDWNGEVVDWVWNRWLNNDINTQVQALITDGETPFEEVEIYFDCADHDGLLLQYQAQVFDQALTSNGIVHNYQEYQGYDNYPAGHNNFIYDRLAEILKFHSRCFPEPEEEE
jgi:S-formylglutathione hydrolase FrmB